ncbi:hypothetical protein AAFF_G00186210 [Aldrovandia affinis]|uniref:Uncharacterized protein n=1 Tax=Aldrovandia affinis TaxID=143900 RepID=A0AAD7SXM4_9TELE|nr:hypothetical protein AAFF_G00186210 [Aldrovandia affinis]
MAVQWSRVELIRLTTVLQDCEDQLAVLGHIMPKACTEHLDVDKRGKVEELSHGEEVGLAEELRSQRESDLTLENKHPPPDTLVQVEYDRDFVAEVIMNVLKELRETGTFHSLLIIRPLH